MAGYTILPDDEEVRGVRRSDVGPSIDYVPAPRVTEEEFRPGGPRALAADEYNKNSRTLRRTETADDIGVKPNAYMQRMSSTGGALRPVAGAYTILADEDAAAPVAEPEEPATFAERQKERAALEKQASDIEKEIARAENSVPLSEGAAQGAALAKIAALKKELAALNTKIERTSVGTIGRTVGSIVGGVGGAIGGGMAGSAVAPGLGTVAGGMAGSAAGTAAGSYLGTKFDLWNAGRNAVEVTPEQASQFVKDSVIDDVMWDGIGNAVLFGGGRAIKLAVNPAYRAELKKIVYDAVAKKRAANMEEPLKRATNELLDDTSLKTGTHLLENVEEAAARAEAVPQLISKSGGYLPSEGQITGKPSLRERISRGVAPRAYEDAQPQLARGMQEMKGEFLEPPHQLTRPDIGHSLADSTEATIDTIKKRTGKTFEEARGLGIAVDMEPTIKRLQHYISEYERGGSTLSKGEVGSLRDTLALLENQRVTGPAGGVYLAAGDAQGFVSARKQAKRDLIDGNPMSTYMEKALGEVADAADNSYIAALDRADPLLKKELLLARGDYFRMSDTMVSSDLRAALRKKPEDVGEFFYSKGTVTEVKNLDKALDMAIKEKAMTPADANLLRESLTRDFIGRMAADPAKWTQVLRDDKRLRDTFNALTSRPGMENLSRSMRIIEEAAKIAERKNDTMRIGGTVANAPSRAGVGLVFGFIGATMGTVLLGASGLAKVMATAATRGDKGMWRKTEMLMQAYKQGDKVIAAPAIRTAVEDVIKYASDNSIDLLASQQPQQPTQEQ